MSTSTATIETRKTHAHTSEYAEALLKYENSRVRMSLKCDKFKSKCEIQIES